MKSKVAVIGATGMLGKIVTNEMLAAGWQVSIIARNADKAKKMFPSASILEADVFNSNSLERALHGQEIVYISLSPNRNATQRDPMPEREGIDNIIAASKKCGVKRIALLSSLVQRYEGMNNFHWWIFEMKIRAVDQVKKSGLSYSIFYPSSFMETVDRDIIQGSNIILTTGSVAKMWFISGQDYAKQVVNALEIAETKNQEYSIQGPEAFDWYEAAKIMKANHKKRLRTIKAPIGIMKLMGKLVPMISYGWHICEALNKYPEQFESENAWRELGKPEMTLEKYVKSL